MWLLKKVVGEYCVKKELSQDMEGKCARVFKLGEVLVALITLAGELIQCKHVLIHWAGRIVDEAKWEDTILIKS